VCTSSDAGSQRQSPEVENRNVCIEGRFPLVAALHMPLEASNLETKPCKLKAVMDADENTRASHGTKGPRTHKSSRAKRPKHAGQLFTQSVPETCSSADIPAQCTRITLFGLARSAESIKSLCDAHAETAHDHVSVRPLSRQNVFIAHDPKIFWFEKPRCHDILEPMLVRLECRRHS
jgi:hypothetical protein